MKILNSNILLFFAVILMLSCGYSNTNSDSHKLKKDPGLKNHVSINDCIKRILYIESQIDVEDYDSISLHYFHNLEEYVEPEAIALSKQIDSLFILKHSDSISDMSAIGIKIDSLKAELSPYQKFVIGYAFVHTFYDGKDTISGIFVMDTLCGFGEMTEIKDKIIIDPITNAEYSKKVKKQKAQ